MGFNSALKGLIRNLSFKSNVPGPLKFHRKIRNGTSIAASFHLTTICQSPLYKTVTKISIKLGYIQQTFVFTSEQTHNPNYPLNIHGTSKAFTSKRTELTFTVSSTSVWGFKPLLLHEWTRRQQSLPCRTAAATSLIKGTCTNQQY